MKYGELLDRILEAQRLLLEKEIEANTVILNSNKYSVFIEPGYRPTVFGMAVEFANLPPEHDFIVQHKTRKTTNADRIRSMTDEELAEWFAGHDAGLVANVLNNDYVEPTKDGWLEWLET